MNGDDYTNDQANEQSNDQLMIEIQLGVEGETQVDAFLDPYEVEELLESTAHELHEHVQRRLEGFVCDEHGKPPKVLVSGVYSLETEQLDVNYNIEACCNRMVMQTAALLSRA